MSVHEVVVPQSINENGGLAGFRGIHRRIWNSVFRKPAIPQNELEHSKAVADNFFLHIHSAKVHDRTLKFRTTLGLGLLSFFMFIILVVTGVLLMFYYVPTPAEAYNRMLDLRGAVFFGDILRNLHRWAAHAMVLLVVLHMVRVFLTGAHKAPREFNWCIGVVLLLLTLFMSFTGYLLPWDQLAYWAIVVGTSIAGYAPVVGKSMQFVLLGDYSVGGEALLRFYVLHCVALPAVLLALVGAHFWRIRKDGGLARPHGNEEGDSSNTKATVSHMQPGEAPSFERFPARAGKTYGLMCVVERSSPATKVEPECQVQSWPAALNRELALFVISLLVLSIFALIFKAPLEDPANPLHPPNPAKAPWYFLGLQELVSYDAFWGGIGIPGILVLLALLAPYLEWRKGGEGVWFHRSRSAANWMFLTIMLTLGILTIIGSLFRGVNWQFTVPW